MTIERSGKIDIAVAGGSRGLHVLAKPIGPICDIKCDYCFYLEKRALFERNEHYRMPDEVLKKLYYKNALRVIPGIDKSLFPE